MTRHYAYSMHTLHCIVSTVRKRINTGTTAVPPSPTVQIVKPDTFVHKYPVCIPVPGYPVPVCLHRDCTGVSYKLHKYKIVPDMHTSTGLLHDRTGVCICIPVTGYPGTRVSHTICTQIPATGDSRKFHYPDTGTFVHKYRYGYLVPG